MTLVETWRELAALEPKVFSVPEGETLLHIFPIPVGFGIDGWAALLLVGPLCQWMAECWPESYVRATFVSFDGTPGTGGTWEATGTRGKWWPSPIVAVGDTQPLALAQLALQFLKAEHVARQ